MTPRFKRYLAGSAAFHVGLILLLLLGALVGRLRHQKRKKDLTVIEFQVTAPPAGEHLQPVEKVSIPEPPPEPPPDIPEPVKKKPKPKKPKIEKSKKRVRRKPPKPPRKAMTPEEIRKMLASGVKPSKQPTSNNAGTSVNWYYALVRQTMYDAWREPSELAGAGLVASVEICIERSGRISGRELVAPSGNRVMDDSVMTAVRSVSRLKPLPDEIPGAHKYLTIEFELTGGAR